MPWALNGVRIYHVKSRKNTKRRCYKNKTAALKAIRKRHRRR